MYEPDLKHRIEALVREGVESPYIDRLRARVNPAQSFRDIEREIVSEMAQALGMSEEKLERALLELDVIAHRIKSLGDSPDAQRLADLEARYDAQREVCLRRRWELEVHREAVGFKNHAALDKLHPIPPKRGRAKSE